MWLTLTSLRRPVTLAMALASLVLLGAVSVLKLPLDFLPRVEFPFIAVYIPYQGGIPSENELTWSRDGERLFFGYEWIDPVVEARRLEKKEEKREERARKEAEEVGEELPEEDAYDPYDVEGLVDERGLDVWHGDDPRIIPNQKKQWDEVEKKRRYLAVAHVGSGKVVRLAGVA